LVGVRWIGLPLGPVPVAEPLKENVRPGVALVRRYTHSNQNVPPLAGTVDGEDWAVGPETSDTGAPPDGVRVGTTLIMLYE
jgi:hypothetical protein